MGGVLVDKAAWDRVIRGIKRIERLIPSGRGVGMRRQLVGGGNPDPGLWARITGATLLTGETARWSYAWTEQSVQADGTFAAKSGGRTSVASGEALNTVEANNGAQGTGIKGNSVTQSGADYPAGFQLMRVRGDPVVWLRPMVASDDSETTWWLFAYENADDGTCE